MKSRISGGGQEDKKFKVIPSYIESWRPASAIGDSVLSSPSKNKYEILARQAINFVITVIISGAHTSNQIIIVGLKRVLFTHTHTHMISNVRLFIHLWKLINQTPKQKKIVPDNVTTGRNKKVSVTAVNI